MSLPPRVLVFVSRGIKPGHHVLARGLQAIPGDVIDPGIDYDGVIVSPLNAVPTLKAFRAEGVQAEPVHPPHMTVQ